MRRGLIVGLMVLLTAGTAAGVDPQVASKFDDFCKGWMQKLEARERDNRANIKWTNSAEGTRGEYVGYSKEHECKLKQQADPKAVPVGTISYIELRYQQSGSSQGDAAKSAPTVLERTEVIEIFRYSKGEWVF